MAFYTAEWVRKLIKQDQKEFIATVTKDKNDFRTYVDRVLPFTLYLGLEVIKKEVLYTGAPAVVKLAAYLGVSEEDTKNLLLAGYARLITKYNKGDVFPVITREAFEEKISQLSVVYDSPDIRAGLKNLFSKTLVIQSNSNSYSIIMFPSFSTVSSRFGGDFREALRETKAYQALPNDTFDSLQVKLDRFLEGKKDGKELAAGTNLAELQNLGHIEVDLISSVKGSKEVKRGLVSPRLLQALVTLPKDIKPQNLAKVFSRDTGQANTRVVVRKKFSGTKMVLEMLVESGIMIGSLESREQNLSKSTLEKNFKVGQGLTAKLRDKTEAAKILAGLETSKSISQYLEEEIVRAITTGKTKPYSSSTTIKESTKVSLEKVNTKLPKNKSSVNIPLPKFKTSSRPPLSSLQSLLDAYLVKQVKDNMQTASQFAAGSRQLLTNRTGRFAESVEVKRLTESRAGMITVFYSYMKNPYATFSNGGAQQSPKTRDPKLLIAKSIRQIAAQQAYNNLRAVNV